MESSAALIAAAEAHAYGLSWEESEIMECWVGIRCDAEAHPAGMPYSVRVDVSIPGHKLIAPRVQHADVQHALADAFADMELQLKAVDANINHAEYAPTINGELTMLPDPDKPPR